ncbi:MAG TPA: WbuC family cupin fold metalloprotein [Bacteroidales bacterium]|jgi:cupin fold WbuC family metalloprotein|nr:WbuC family cupin fold metalloprotein [Bacteroidales bacterium]HPE42955.1 WbuC family cupin fold metalloprotein [Bacteroidales bacterium]
MIKIDENLIEKVSAIARSSIRKRTNLNFHDKSEALMQRMLNAMEPGTYIQPHKHENPDKSEAFFCLRGKILVVEFEEDGQVRDHILLDASKGNYGCEINPRTYHCIVSMETGSVAYELKDGPYDPTIDKHFAPWAPAEGDPDAADYLKNLLKKLGF